MKAFLKQLALVAEQIALQAAAGALTNYLQSRAAGASLQTASVAAQAGATDAFLAHPVVAAASKPVIIIGE